MNQKHQQNNVGVSAKIQKRHNMCQKKIEFSLTELFCMSSRGFSKCFVRTCMQQFSV